MELREALTQIETIRTQIAKVETFRGYRAATVGFSGLLALAAGALQSAVAPYPQERPAAYLTLWISVAALSLLATAGELTLRCLRAKSPHTRRLTVLAAEQFLPCVAAGAVLTVVLVRSAEASLWMLPGLWSILFSLGVFASVRLLPRATVWVALFYLLAGGYLLSTGPLGPSLSPWAMASVFGLGQLAAAAILYVQLERSYG